MNKKGIHSGRLICIPLLLLGINATCQFHASFTLDSLQKMAHENYPLIQQLELAKRAGNEAVKNQNSKWLPQTQFVGSASYQSEVTSLSLPASFGFSPEKPAKDQYKTGIELSQQLFDAGLTSAKKTVDEINEKIEEAGIEGKLLQLKNTVNDLFSAILGNKKVAETLTYVESDLHAREKNLQTAIESGMALNTTKRELDAEIINVEQEMIENKNQLVSLCTSLSYLVQDKLDTTTVFVTTDKNDFALTDDYSDRPELKSFSAQQEMFSWQKKIINKSNMPHLSLFGSAYYGRPGFNSFNNDLRLYGIAGVTLSWNIGGIYSSSHQKQQLNISVEKIENQKQLFDLNIKNKLAGKEQDILKLNELINKDDEIVNIRKEVKDVATVQYENGTITTTDYVIKLNAESKALINRDIHKIQLVIAYAQYKSLLGK